MIAEFVYFGGAAMSVACALLLFKSYHLSGKRLLLWSSLSFTFLALNNIFIFFDLVVFSEINLGGAMVRNGLGATAGVIMLFGLIWELT